MFNRIIRQVADEVRIELTPEEHQSLSRSQTIDKEAFDAYLKSYAHWDDLSEEGTKKGIEYLNAAVEKDPDWAPLYAGLAQLWGIRVQMGSETPETGMPKVFGYMDQAMELDPDFADIHFNKAIFGTWLEWDWTKGEKEFLEALAINPSDAMSRIYYAHLLAILQQNDEAIIQGRIATEIDPQNPLIHALYAAVFMMTRDWEAAMDQLEKALALDPGHFFALQFMDVVAFHLGDYDLVLQAFKGFLPFPETFFDSINTLYREQGFDAAYEKVVLEMVNTGYGVPFDYAMRYLLLNQYDKALDWLEIGYEVNDPNMPYIGTGFNSIDSLYDHPRILAIMDKMNLPLPAE
jgi:tetratricopeptide (TPR) repeat protein